MSFASVRARCRVGVHQLGFWLLAGLVLLPWAPVALAQSDVVVRRIPVLSNGGTLALMRSGKVWFFASAAVPARVAYSGSVGAVNVVPAGGGAVTLLGDGRAFFSPNGLNLGGGGVTVPAYSGTESVVRIASVNKGVVTLLSGGRIYFSPDGLNLGGGGNTELAYAGRQKVVDLVEVSGGIKTRFSGGGIYLSLTGLNLGGGGATLSTPAWNRVSANSAFGPRDSAKPIVLREGGISISSGFYRSPNWSYSDLWTSKDSGETWQLEVGNIDPLDSALEDLYEPYSPVVPLGSDLLAIGRSVWRSADAKSWQKVSNSGPAMATEDTFAFHFKGRIVVIQTHYGKIFTSDDGISWSAPRVVPGMPTRCGAAVTMAREKLWIMGGSSCNYLTSYDDIWSSEDGVNWQRATAGPDGELAVLPWGIRMWPATCSDGNTIWAFGGFRLQGDSRTNLSDIWYSRDGVTWRQMVTRGSTFGAGLEPRHAAACFVEPTKNRVLVVAGKGGADGNNDRASVRSDVWALELPRMPVEP